MKQIESRFTNLSYNGVIPANEVEFVPYVSVVREDGLVEPIWVYMLPSLILARLDWAITTGAIGREHVAIVLAFLRDHLTNPNIMSDMIEVGPRMTHLTGFFWTFGYGPNEVELTYTPYFRDTNSYGELEIEGLTDEAESIIMEIGLRGGTTQQLFYDVCQQARPLFSAEGIRDLIERHGELNWTVVTDERALNTEWCYCCYALSGRPFILSKPAGGSWEFRNDKGEVSALNGDFHYEISALFARLVVDTGSNNSTEENS